MNRHRKLLLETLSNHFALLAEAHPRRAASPLARKARLSVETSLRGRQLRHRSS